MANSSKPRLFDTHCHVDFSQFDEDRDAMFERMALERVDYAVVVAVEYDHIDALKSLAESRENIWFSVGIHPNHEVEHEPTIDWLRSVAQHPKCVAIGETGMDFFRHRVEPELQESRFRTHIAAAQQLGKPVIVHNRDADEASIRILKDAEIQKCGGIMHCFSSNWPVAKEALDIGMHISFSGNVTFKRNEELREAARHVPLDRLLVETDAPFLAPVPHRGKRNEPAYVRHVAECIAGVKGISMEELSEATTRNAFELFGISPSA